MLPGEVVSFRLLHLPDDVADNELITVSSVAFVGGEEQQYPADIVTEASGRYARVRVPLLRDAAPGDHPALVALGPWVLGQTICVDFERPTMLVGDVLRVDARGLCNIAVRGLSRNAPWWEVAVDIPPQEPDAWIGLVPCSGGRCQYVGLSPGVPGGRYPAQARVTFHGGRQELVRGNVHLPK